MPDNRTYQRDDSRVDKVFNPSFQEKCIIMHMV